MSVGYYPGGVVRGDKVEWGLLCGVAGEVSVAAILDEERRSE